jgi:hypothetical protein
VAKLLVEFSAEVREAFFLLLERPDAFLCLHIFALKPHSEFVFLDSSTERDVHANVLTS